MKQNSNTINKTACMICIGSELLNGEVSDQNLQPMSKKLVVKGIDLQCAIFIKDSLDTIATTIRDASKMYDYVFTSGGIGSTHDDITTEAVCKCFGVGDLFLEDIAIQMEQLLGRRLNEMEKKMATIPDGAKIIKNSITIAPGYMINNVFVMAGVPSIFDAMSNEALKMVSDGKRLYSKTMNLLVNESVIAKKLLDIASLHKDVDIGSYPMFNNKEDILSKTKIVIRGYSIHDVESAHKDMGHEFECYTEHE